MKLRERIGLAMLALPLVVGIVGLLWVVWAVLPPSAAIVMTGLGAWMLTGLWLTFK